MLRALAALALLSSCMVGDPEEVPADDGTDDGTLAAEAVGDPSRLDVGFNDGHVEQFDYYADFFNASAIHPGPRLCHAYFAWNVGNQAPHAGVVTAQGSRAFVDHWFASAQGHCDDVLVSFQAYAHGAPPSTAAFADAFEKFAGNDWRAETGYTGTISYTPWNEPNNGANDGNGLGAAIDARLAARYYLAAARSCRAHGCKVAAGDFASNGNMWNDFEWNCANDNVAPSELCSTKSSANPGDKPASYLDRYKNEIVARSHEFGMPAGFRPEAFAFHGWHDSNSYLNTASHCSAYGDCALRRILKSLGGSWRAVALWNTEDGIGQTSAPDDREQACGAAFLVRLQTITSRLHRLYITRLHGGAGQLLVDHQTPRPAMFVLARRETSYAAGNCR
jgi:hypothetical protein